MVKAWKSRLCCLLCLLWTLFSFSFIFIMNIHMTKHVLETICFFLKLIVLFRGNKTCSFGEFWPYCPCPWRNNWNPRTPWLTQKSWTLLPKHCCDPLPSFHQAAVFLPHKENSGVGRIRWAWDASPQSSDSPRLSVGNGAKLLRHCTRAA